MNNDSNTNENVQVVMKDIEKKTEIQVRNLLKTENANTNTLVQIMTKGSDEFKERTGRNMSYSEMREMFG
jgi:hypothetical protein